MGRKQIEDRVYAMAAKLLEGQTELELVDVEYVREQQDYYLRVYIDKAGGIDIDDCQFLSEKLEEQLDAENVVPGQYILEVSSPGIDRVLRKERDFVREQGKKVDVKLYQPLLDGKKAFTAVLTGYDAEAKTLKLDERELPLESIAQIRLHIDF
ncbi:MAG: ribosome maturation factor RimP [Selenomonadaceae bacterium]|nr:ribosome maturation factor RimP [Selenomonadaceae bacterium]